MKWRGWKNTENETISNGRNMIEITESPDTKQWGEFVLNHSCGSIFQTPEMAEVYRRTKNYAPVTLAVVDTKPFLKKKALPKKYYTL